MTKATRLSLSAPSHGSLARGLLALGLLALTTLVAWRALRGEEPHRAAFGGTPIAVPDSAWRTLADVLSVSEAIQDETGWLLLDRSGDQVHVLSEEGAPIRSLGGPGDGPGELSHPAAFAIVSDTLWVADLSATRFDGFTRDGAFVRRVHTDPACTVPVLDDLAAEGDGLVVAVRCFSLLGSRRRLSRFDPASGRTSPAGSLPDDDPKRFGDVTRLVANGDRLLAGSMFRRCMYALPGTQAAACLDIADRVQVPPDVMEALEAGSARRRLMGFVRQTPPFYPYFIDAFSTPTGVVMMQPESEDQVVLTHLGRPRTTIRLPAGTTAFVGRNRILLARPVVEGTRIALAQMPVEWR